jgi:hypothetical protein
VGRKRRIIYRKLETDGVPLSLDSDPAAGRVELRATVETPIIEVAGSSDGIIRNRARNFSVRTTDCAAA